MAAAKKHVGPALRPDARAEARTHMMHEAKQHHVGIPVRCYPNLMYSACSLDLDMDFDLDRYLYGSS
jgi:hypothetical protein